MKFCITRGILEGYESDELRQDIVRIHRRCLREAQVRLSICWIWPVSARQEIRYLSYRLDGKDVPTGREEA